LGTSCRGIAREVPFITPDGNIEHESLRLMQQTPCIGRDAESNRERNSSRNLRLSQSQGYLFSRTNDSPIYDKTQGAFRALPKYTRRGWPDICLIKSGVFYGIDVKAEKGKLSAHQQTLGEEIERNGAKYIVARSIDDLQAAG
jgi:hypothetical protein